ncbi:MAG: glycosyltransferase family 2 protein [Deltaproteobacteria bacterium]|nr:MAG: glycosyltransferase family 2 protein [Deltaproteobacteria bacterium]
MKEEQHVQYPLVTISILNWLNFSDTISCIRSLQGLNYPNVEIIVRDNASPNDSYEQLKSAFPELHIERPFDNNGFAAGHYQNYLIAKEKGADLFWILNSDLELKEDTLTKLMEAYQQFGEHIYGSVSLDPTQQELVDFGGAEWTEDSKKKLNYNVWKGRSYTELKERHPEVYEVESVEGSSMLIPMEVIEKFGFMHTDFFMYGEETDYCYRMRQNGVRSMVVTTSLVTHHNEGSTKINPELKAIPAYYRRRNALRFFMEHLGMGSMEALAYQNGVYTNLKTVLKGTLSHKKDLNYFYALACWHAFLGKKGKTVNPEEFLK